MTYISILNYNTGEVFIYTVNDENIEDYVSDISFGCFADWLENDQFVIMQSTGLFDKNGRMLTLGAFGRKVSPAVGNIQAAGENLWQAREALCEQLPFIVTQHEAHLGY